MYNERKIQAALINKFWSASRLMMPCYTPRGWWECDLYRVTTAGYFYEYEIKLTRADWKRDSEKRQLLWGPGFKRYRGPAKHESFEKNENGPKRFWWVVPIDLIQPEEIEEWAGLFYTQQASGNRVVLREIKKAKAFNRQKVEKKELDKARERSYYRYLRSI